MIELKQLSRPLKPAEVMFLPLNIFRSKKNNKPYAKAGIYKKGRTDMAILDEVVGPHLWSNLYKRDTKGVLQCGIGIKMSQDWVWKWSNGVPSEYEPIKGEYTDAFKRAGFMWGIGRDLYDAPEIIVQLDEEEVYSKDGRLFATTQLKMNLWKWSFKEQYLGLSASYKEKVRHIFSI